MLSNTLKVGTNDERGTDNALFVVQVWSSRRLETINGFSQAAMTIGTRVAEPVSP
jgi:hypothetical protein